MRIVNPATDETLADLVDDAPEAITAKLERARAAQPGWAALPLDRRIEAIRRFRQLVEARTDELARTTTTEMGKPITQSKNELRGLLGRIDFFVSAIARELADEIVHEEPGLQERISHEPLGVVLNVSAWNYPYFVGGNAFLPALLAGNAVVYKPSEFSTLTGLGLARALHDAGVPEDVFVPVVGGPDAGRRLVEEPFDAVLFTGSHATGRRIAEARGKFLSRLGLELGGKDPAYVAADADPAHAAAALADGAFYNAGQSCCAVERIYVARELWQPFTDAFLRGVAGFVVGDPLDERTYIGPLARREAALLVLEQQVADAISRGARVATGGKRLERQGSFFAPTVLVDVDHSMAVMKDESFGPIIGLQPVDSDDEATALMQDTEYGLTAAVYSRDRGRAERILAKLDVGSAYWNCCDRVSPRLPWSGRRHSGLGCTLSSYGVEAFLRPKAWHFREPE